ncbi:hypothetical protein OEV98_12685 [Caldibacillus lycopersici]|uniref:Uncharacterized protein n=1 Tax=Perspicuibacillus lycopersici TaxID=1325689 RepID=A0AAE3ITK9_9BACI|nr:hypothetical protein [Perspicuibacillus lycopersici]MCU9614393.1 hypothetical protein [Perspicuibacillus lycopersici]
MLKAIGVLFIFLLIAFFQVPQLIKTKLFRELWIFSFLLFFVAIITILRINNLFLPNPLEIVAFALDPLIRLFLPN